MVLASTVPLHSYGRVFWYARKPLYAVTATASTISGVKRRALLRGAAVSATAVEAVVVTCQLPVPLMSAGPSR